MVKKVFIFLLTAVVFLSCQNVNSIKRISSDGLMYAMIYDYDNTPVNAVAVYIDGRKVVDSDIQGRFILEKMDKGEYTIKLTKRGYETFEENFYFDPLQVLYFKMISTRQLVTLAETALDSKDFFAAENYIIRAQALEPARHDILYLKAISCYLQDRREEANLILENLLRSGNNQPAVIRLYELTNMERE